MSILKKPLDLLKIIISIGARIQNYIIPFILLYSDFYLRNELKLDGFKFIGPGFVAAGMGLSLPVTYFNSRKKATLSLSDKVNKAIEAKGFFVDSKRARYLRIISAIVVLILSICWIVLIWISFCSPTFSPTLTKIIQLGIEIIQFGLGIFCYTLGVVINEIKELVDEFYI